MPQLVLVRHGNTFEAGEPPRMVGGKTDLNLTEAGIAQSKAMAAMVASRFAPLGGIVTGPLIRTRRMAKMIGEAAGTIFTVDERLSEICYGQWENKTNDEIRAAFGAEILEAWEKEGAWPEGMDWAPSQKKLEHNIRDFLAEQHRKLLLPQAGNRVAVTSNGILRFIYHLASGKPPSPEAKVRTGHHCVLSPLPDEGWLIELWDMSP